MNYKIGDHVVCEKSNGDWWDYNGKTGVINQIDLSYRCPYRCKMDDGSPDSWCTVKGLVEDKKVFTKSDLKNGDVIVRQNGSVEIVMLDLGMLITCDGWNNLNEVMDDLTDEDSYYFDDGYDIVKVYRPVEKYHCSFTPSHYEHGELVYDRERDTKPVEPPKPLYNGKVVCIDNIYNTGIYTVGKIYQFEDGNFTSDKGDHYPGNGTPIYTFEDWAKWTSSKFIEIKE